MEDNLNMISTGAASWGHEGAWAEKKQRVKKDLKSFFEVSFPMTGLILAHIFKMIY